MFRQDLAEDVAQFPQSLFARRANGPTAGQRRDLGHPAIVTEEYQRLIIGDLHKEFPILAPPLLE